MLKSLTPHWNPQNRQRLIETWHPQFNLPSVSFTLYRHVNHSECLPKTQRWPNYLITPQGFSHKLKSNWDILLPAFTVSFADTQKHLNCSYNWVSWDSRKSGAHTDSWYTDIQLRLLPGIGMISWCRTNVDRSNISVSFPETELRTWSTPLPQ